MARETGQDGEGHQTLRCSGCGQWKRVEEFYPNSKKRGGYSGKCRECIKTDRKERYRGLTGEEKQANWWKALARRQQQPGTPDAVEKARERSGKFEKDAGGAWIKWCNQCEQWLALAHFAEDARQLTRYSVWCKECTRRYNAEQVKNQTPEQKEAARRQRARYHKDRWGNDPAYKQRILEYNRDKRAAMTPEERQLERRERHLKQQFGITRGDFGKLFVAAMGKCQICRTRFKPIHRRDQPQDGAYPCIDHCHDCSAIRGLLCHRCNGGLGQFKDLVGRIMDAREYLRRAAAQGSKE